MDPNVVRGAAPNEAPMRNAKTGAAVGPAAKLIGSPIGVVQVAGLPQCHRMWTRNMKGTARRAAGAKARIRSRRVRPVTALTADSPPHSCFGAAPLELPAPLAL